VSPLHWIEVTTLVFSFSASVLGFILSFYI
jgi:hypothetical protein